MRKLDWSKIHLVIFDVDGTLYPQRPLRFRMAQELALDSARVRSWRTLRVLKAYRALRERMGEQELFEFEPLLITETAAAAQATPDEVQMIVSEWIETRPLRHLKALRYRSASELFSGLKANGKVVGVLSDYPAQAKLSALGLQADHCVSATDPEVSVLKPHPRGVQRLIVAADCTPEQTLVIGDRPDRDGVAARRAGAQALILSSRPARGWLAFSRFDDPLFHPMLSS